MHGVVRDDAFRFVEVAAAGVEIPIEAREIAARDFDAQPVTRVEIVARVQRLQRDLVHSA